MMNDVLQLLENLGIDAPAIQLWIFPEEDFAAYRELYGEEACDTYKEYVNDKMEMARHSVLPASVHRPIGCLGSRMIRRFWAWQLPADTRQSREGRVDSDRDRQNRRGEGLRPGWLGFPT